MFITAEEIKELSSLDEVKALSNIKVSQYMERADSWIIRETGRRDLITTEDEFFQKDLATATLLLVEYLWFLDLQEVKESNMSGLDSERIGTYSYNRSASRSDTFGSTNNEELNQILNSLKVRPDLNFFNVSKPSKMKDC